MLPRWKGSESFPFCVFNGRVYNISSNKVSDSSHLGQGAGAIVIVRHLPPSRFFPPKLCKSDFDELTAQKIMNYLSTCKNYLVFAIAKVIALFSIFEVSSAVYTKHCRQEGLPQSFLSADIKLIASLRCNSRSSRNQRLQPPIFSSEILSKI